ncbi:MAG: 50S ribosomal protein L13 [Myxococcaceae bacterium]|nr:50S ribosomal protein L13 [Myxococcaceae bacterium]MBH2006314.1 50S ribosomal protein L13 [Myxococcaceae bacterium]
MKTPNLSEKSINREWFVVDATNAVVGRLATQVASVLRGKHKPIFTPHLDTGDFVVVVNAGKARFTGTKEVNKQYWRYTGFPGGERSRTPTEQRERAPERIMFAAIKGMLPKGPLGRQMLTKLKVYADAEHPHAAQQPKPLTVLANKGA